MASTTLTIGRVYCGKIRRYLDKKAFISDVKYIESKGFMRREFTIKGSDSDILSVLRDLESWIDENNL